MAELLFELLSEEIPARMQARAASDLERAVSERLKAAQLPFTSAESFVTPRRLVVVVDGLPLQTATRKEVRRGPRVGAPPSAIEGFLRSVGRPSIDSPEIKVEQSGKGEVYVFEALIAPLPTERELPSILQDAVEAIIWPKSMRWLPGQTLTWVRPIRSVLALFDRKTLDLEIELIHTPQAVLDPKNHNRLVAGNETLGHRVHHPEKITVKSFADYRERLMAARVVLDPAERQRRIAERAGAAAAAAKLSVKDDPALLAEVVGLVEWPVVVMGAIDERFMEVPPEVLTTAMRTHQKYFATLRPDGSLAPRFIAVANVEAPDGGKAIVAGNERVLRARLADARFFWDQDRRRKLEDRVAALDDIVFHARLGSVGAKVARLQTLAAELSEFVPDCDRDLARSAALLSKADLTTGMVGEFPELQGIMGRYYALEEGEKPEVAEAIADHYAPAGPNDRCPTRPVSVAVALADKLDTLFWFFAIEEKPTGSKDPFALRRAALGIVRLILENRLRLPLREAFARTRGGEAVDLDRSAADRVSEELVAFFADRLKAHLREQGVRHDLVSAVFSLTGEDDLVRLLARVDALQRFLGTDDGANLLIAYRRAANIVRIEERKDGVGYDGAPDEAALAQPEEVELLRRLREAEGGAQRALGAEDFVAAMGALAALRGPVDAFFDRVTVNADEPGLRANRLRLLSQIRATMNRVADFAQIEG